MCFSRSFSGCFNSAPAARPGGTLCRSVTAETVEKLQFGPGGSAGGDLTLRPEAAELGHASIRPRRLGRGGLCRPANGLPRSLRLQFGPGGSAGGDDAWQADRHRHLVASIRPRRLGRGGRGSRIAFRRRANGFNSAPAARPGGTFCVSMSWISCAELQFGPGGSAGGDAVHNCPLQLGVIASIRPRRLGRGGRREADRSDHGQRSFNSAPAARPGGTRNAGRTGRARKLLQFGPGGSAGGDSSLTKGCVLAY